VNLLTKYRETEIMMSFKNLNLINPIIRAVTEAGYSKPTEIQYSAIPHILAGKDIIGCAQTGTGKRQHLQCLFFSC
jgi:ATP-dependent RNA helicase RhlE